MRFAHTMVRVTDIDASLDFWCTKFGLIEVRRKDYPAGRFTLIFLAAPKDKASAQATQAPELELTFNWDGEAEPLQTGRSWGHLAYRVDDIYASCQRLKDAGVVINRPPRDGYMAFVKSPDNISIELIQDGEPLPPQEPWASMENNGSW
ncbi:lactoylglutathione lyase [Amylibacter marinus]|uniref:Lactoylglutathione lyase n=1 Tax=Amylibacter marinus TaxID=1475483 RepID=A0ABQ5VRT0_9RHOB|nr:VOC family protein [Amylibacter marinus]GLQ33918.1 lactoylglutathione lyase [Amylibacter marinus]